MPPTQTKREDDAITADRVLLAILDATDRLPPRTADANLPRRAEDLVRRRLHDGYPPAV